MNSTDPHSKKRSHSGELDRLVRSALNSRVGQQQPPRRVWKQIKMDLEKSRPSPRRFWSQWPPLAVQAGLTLLLVMLGGASLCTPLNFFSTGHFSRAPVPSASIAYVEEQAESEAPAMLDDREELRLLKAFPKPDPSSPVDAEPANRPSLVVERSASSRVAEAKGAAPEAGSTLSSETNVKDRLHSGAYPWIR